VLVYSVDTDGSERYTIHTRDLDSSTPSPLSIENTIGEPTWIPGADVFFYLELSEEWRPFRVRLHRGETGDGANDPILYEEQDEGFFVDAELSQDRKYLIITSGDHETSEVRVVPTSDCTRDPVLVCKRRAGHRYHVDHGRDGFYILTNDTCVNFRLVTAPDDTPGEDSWREIVAGRDDVYLSGFTPFARFMLVEERVNATDRVVIRSHEGEQHTVAFDEPIHIATPGANPEFDVSSVRLHYESMVTPPTVYDYDVATRALTERKVSRIPSGYEKERYRVDRILAPARDGATVPVSIVYRDDFRRDGSGFVHLYGYGAYGYGTMPGFSRAALTLLDRGFAFAIAHVRGGDEMGYGWYLAGKRMQRWNTYTDFIDAATALVEARFTSPGRICISGGSAGGELVGVALNVAPELFAAAVAHVPFVDVLNTMLDETLPLTPMEWPEWGNPVEDPAAFAYIRSYSPYDNVRQAPYPPLLVTAGLNDPRVTYWEPAKWVARLRTMSTSGNVVLLKTNMGAGHAGKSGRFQHLIETAEEMSFFLLATGHAGA
jgi:oligopeptidase B